MKGFIKLFLLELCCSYTLISVLGAVVNIIGGTEINNFNVIMMFLFCLIIVGVLNTHKLFEDVSPLVMIIVQYVLSFAFCSLLVFLSSILIEPVSPRGWFEYIRSFTIPYILGAALYYYGVFRDAKEQSELISQIQDLSGQK